MRVVRHLQTAVPKGRQNGYSRYKNRLLRRYKLYITEPNGKKIMIFSKGRNFCWGRPLRLLAFGSRNLATPLEVSHLTGVQCYVF
jgi:hypothetical protein